MKALYFDGSLALTEVPQPELKPGEVLIQVHLAGICSTDLEVLKGFHHFRGVMGHEFVGQVAGPADSPWLGRRVVGEISVGCGRCDLCRQGLAPHCHERQVLGLMHRNGVFAPYLSLPEANLHPVPPDLPDDAAVFTELLAAAVAVLEAAPLAAVSRVLVIGDGPLGLLISWILALTGVQVHLVGHYPDHLALAQPYGVITFFERDLKDRDYEVVVEASGAPAGLDLALNRVRPRGAVVLKSTYAGRYGLDLGALVVPEVSLIGCRCGSFPKALRLLAQRWIDPLPLIAHRFPLSMGLQAIAQAQQPGTLKVLLDMQEEAGPASK